MNKYIIKFEARKLGAIGKLKKYEHVCYADKLKNVILDLYNEYDHVRILSLIKKGIGNKIENSDDKIDYEMGIE